MLNLSQRVTLMRENLPHTMLKEESLERGPRGNLSNSRTRKNSPFTPARGERELPFLKEGGTSSPRVRRIREAHVETHRRTKLRGGDKTEERGLSGSHREKTPKKKNNLMRMH